MLTVDAINHAKKFLKLESIYTDFHIPMTINNRAT